MKNREKELVDRMAKLRALDESLNADTATVRDQVKEDLAVEQQTLDELRQRMAGGEDSRELVIQYVDTIGRMGQLHDWLADLEDDIEENRRYSGRKPNANSR